ncbi:MAG: ABC transporter permease, partial [Acidobacteria bacterium]|nr:ABC transporter permease [Acidobacteriota bacterium]
KVNTLLVSLNPLRPRTDSKDGASPARSLAATLKRTYTLPDLGLRIRPLESLHAFSVESDKILIEDPIAKPLLAAAASTFPVVSADEEESALKSIKFSGEPKPAKRSGRPRAIPYFTYLATSIRIGDREIPYSLVTAMDGLPVSTASKADSVPANSAPPIWLNAWAMRDLSAKPGDRVTLEYYVWEEAGSLAAKSTEFILRDAIEKAGITPDRDMSPEFPGITESQTLGDWNPPFPVDLKRVRPRDEEYWKQFRATPKAFLPLDTGQRLWHSRYGQMTALRVVPPGSVALDAAIETYAKNLRANLDPATSGLRVIAVRSEGESSSQGAVNFGEYFLYFSFFIVASGLLLTGMFFKVSVEQRLREIGLLRALGFNRAALSRLFLAEGALLAIAGGLAGLAGAITYGWLMMRGLSTWWVGAVGTRLLRLHVERVTLAAGFVSGILVSVVVIYWTLRSLNRSTARGLLHGEASNEISPASQSSKLKWIAILSAVAGGAIILLAATGKIPRDASFFGAGFLFLISLITAQWSWLVRGTFTIAASAGRAALSRLGARNATWRPGRSVLCMALMASATFIVVAVDSFRRSGETEGNTRHSGTGGYALLAESQIPIAYDLNSAAGKQNLGLSDQDIQRLVELRFVSFRVRPGEDASCLNLYQPRNPKILGVPPSFSTEGRFAFQSSIAKTEQQKTNPWLLLDESQSDGTIPAIADANTLTYIFHLRPGDTYVLNEGTEHPLRLRVVAALSDSMFQSEFLVSEKNFLRAFATEPATSGFRFFLLDNVAPSSSSIKNMKEFAVLLEKALSDYGVSVESTSERLATFHQVENTYISTFQALGGLGLLLGTFGLAAVLLRNVLERRRELALLRAVGYRPADLAWLVVSENALLLIGGLGAGVVAALIAIAPAILERGSKLPALSLSGLLFGVLACGFLASLAAVRAVVRMPLLTIVRSE